MNIEKYDLGIDLDFYTLVLKVHETISIDNPERSINLDALGIDVLNVKLNGTSLPFTQDAKSAKLRIDNLPEHIEKISIEIDYERRVIEDSLYGVYKSRYGSAYFVTTDFEPNGARILFPCIDNPTFKAEFNLQVITQKEIVVVSNSKIERTEEVGGKRKYIFGPTPKMSTYVFYLGMGKFDERRVHNGNIEFRVLARPGYAEKGTFALENAVKYLRAYEEFYSIPYPLKKLDMIALPEYASGAMENWGAITFREVALLVDENSSFANRRNAASVIGHEIAHQWFGNLVTMKWWNDLWLNESFATFMENKITQKLHPDWDVLSSFLQDTTAGAMLGDSLENTHPIDVKVDSPEEISQIFDEISYGKGASILRMIDEYIGLDAFRKGVSNYLKQFRYSNAEGKDLWRKLAEVSGEPVDKIMEAWVKKPGYPFVAVSLKEQTLRFEQERFLFDLEKEAKSDYWPIPLIFRLNGDMSKFVLGDKSCALPISGDITEIKVNFGQCGFYRVLYDKKLYTLIENEFDSLSVLDKWGVVSDLFAFLMAGKVDKTLYFEFARKCYDTTDFIVAEAVTKQLDLLRFILPDHQRIGEAYLAHHMSQIKRLGLDPKEGEKHTDKVLRERIAKGLALVDDHFADELSKRFAEYDNIDPNLRVAVSVAFAQVKGAGSFDKLVETMKRMGNESDVIKIYNALTSFRETDAVRKALDFCISGEISRADSLYAIIDAAENPYAGKVTWNWLARNLHTLRDLFKGTPYISHLLQEVIPRAGLACEEEIRNYFSETRIEEGVSGIKKGLELLEVYSRLKARIEESSVT